MTALRERLLEALKKMAIEMIQDIEDNICTTTQAMACCVAIRNRLELKSELDIMKVAVKLLLPKENEIKTRQESFLFGGGLKKAIGGLVDIELDWDPNPEDIGEEDQKTLWNFVSALLSLVQEYKKNV